MHGPIAAGCDHAGIRPGDLITAINGQTVETQAPYFALRSDAKPGVPVRLSVQHDGATRDIVFTPRVRPDVPPGFASTWTRFHLARFFAQMLSFYPLPFLIVAAVVLLQRPDDPHAWLLALMLGGFIGEAPIANFEFMRRLVKTCSNGPGETSAGELGSQLEMYIVSAI